MFLSWAMFIGLHLSAMEPAKLLPKCSHCLLCSTVLGFSVCRMCPLDKIPGIAARLRNKVSIGIKVYRSLLMAQ